MVSLIITKKNYSSLFTCHPNGVHEDDQSRGIWLNIQFVVTLIEGRNTEQNWTKRNVGVDEFCPTAVLKTCGIIVNCARCNDTQKHVFSLNLRSETS